MKYLGKFWRSIDLLLIICEIELVLKDCALMEHHKNLTEVNFMITVCSIVTLSINDNINFLENIKKGFKRTVSWNIYRSEITTQTKHSD